MGLTADGAPAATRPPPRPRPEWRPALLVADRRENDVTRTLVLRVPGWSGHLPGQHVDVRLTADDGYQASRSYSIAAPADGERVELTVQRVADGEVSPYLVDDLPVGAAIEILGPVGGWFVWRPAAEPPSLLVAGGAGIVPIMAMVRAWRDGGGPGSLRLLYSLRSRDLLCYAAELSALDDGLLLAYTRRAPPGSARPPGRLTPAEVAEYGVPPDRAPRCYVCGPTGFVEAMSALLTGMGHDPARIRTERFGPSGG
ncbi:ferredoxin reductase [Actinomadura rugatobispora]|uniref:Ferredoxin reductase n=1 Tax=Actinomadura rugatobispora TaxID=1994 RepID=A0ABW0ZZP9_9ACTN|nr:ferredoxin reductase [Actinomadura rugatobispora]